MITVLYSAESTTAPDGICSALAEEARSYNLDTDPYVIELRGRDDQKANRELISVTQKQKTFCIEQLQALDLRASTLGKELGHSIASWYVSRCISRFKQGLSSGDSLLTELSDSERSHLASILSRIEAHKTPTDFGVLTMTNKAQMLVHTLQQYADPSLRGIIFVEQRIAVTALVELLGRIPEINSRYRIASFVGTSTSSKRKVSVADLVDVRDQQADLDAFRSGSKNLMICTSVLEEGIDVSSCNLVVCFELPANLVSFVQRRGRARKSGSKYVLFVSSSDRKKQKKPWEELEAQMREQYMDDTRQLEWKMGGEPQPSDKSFRIDATGAVLTLDNAKAHLFHFCSVGTIDASNYVDLRPEFNVDQDPASALWTATVDLPSFVHTRIRHAISSQDWQSPDLAIKDAAFEAYVALYKHGLINDNLLPLTKEYAPETGQHLDQPTIACVSDRKPSLTIHQNSDHEWHCAMVSVCLGAETLVDMMMWMPFPPPSLGDFLLHWNQELAYTLQLQPCTSASILIDAGQLKLMRASTKLLLRSIHASRMSREADDFPVLFTPVGVDDMEGWLEDVQGLQSASAFYSRNGHFKHAGLVRVASQTGRTFFLHGIEAKGVSGAESDQLRVLNFPKRKDFLHPMSSDSSTNAAYSSIHAFPLSDCTIDLLPAKYTIFAAFVPSILHRIDTALLAVELNSTILLDVGISDALLVLEAISAPAAGEVHDYNRLEYLGDTCLKHCTELQVMAQHPTWPESYLTVERDRMVRNTNLAKAALDLGLEKFILTKPFTGSKWRPPYVSEILLTQPKQRQMSTKTLADVVEALIGAAYVDGGLEKALLCIRTLLPTERWHPPQQCFDVLIGELHPSEVTNLALLERLVGHKFAHPTLLVEAITHVSLPGNRTGLSLERLEFLGDSVLDVLVTPKLFAHPRKLRHDQLHGIHEAVVNSAFLGHLCLNFDVEEETQKVVSHGGFPEIEKQTRKIHLYDFLRCGAQLAPLKKKTLAAFNELRAEIDEALASSKEYPWPALVAERPQKFFCDLVESILGALFVDTRGDMAVCEAFAQKLGIFRHMERISNDCVDTLSPKERIGIIADREAVRYVNKRSENEDKKQRFMCTVMVGEESVATVVDCGSKEEAEVKAAHKACKTLASQPHRVARKRKVDAADMSSSAVGDAMEVDEPSSAGATETS